MRLIARKLIKPVLRQALRLVMRSAMLRGLAMRTLNRMPALKMRARNVYFGLLAVPAQAPAPALAPTNDLEPTEQVSVKRALLPPLPVTAPNPLSSPLEQYSRQLVSRSK